MRECGFHQVKHRVDIGREGDLPLFVGDLLGAGECLLVGRVVDQDIDLAELGDGCLDDGTAMPGILHITRHPHRLATGGLDQPAGLVGIHVLVIIAHQDIRPFAGIGQGHGPSDAAIGAGDDRLATGKAPRPFVMRLAVIRARVHVGIPARWRQGPLILEWWLREIGHLKRSLQELSYLRWRRMR